jgi:hypothetical protein
MRPAEPAARWDSYGSRTRGAGRGTGNATFDKAGNLRWQTLPAAIRTRTLADGDHVTVGYRLGNPTLSPLLDSLGRAHRIVRPPPHRITSLLDISTVHQAYRS